MRSFEEHLPEFNARGIHVVAISVDPPEISHRHASKQGYSYLFLSDEKAEIIRRYDLLHSRGGPGQHDIARPAEFLIDSTGTVRWVNLTEDYRVRARAEQVLKAIDDLGLAGQARGQ